MAQHNQTEEKLNIESPDAEQNNQDVVELAKYKHPEEKARSEASAFDQVMSQMNIADRSTFDKKYAQLWKEAGDENELLSIFMCEIDLFKAYHDNYGQQGASFMLLVIGLALKNACEKYGCFLAHYQKEEFGILLKGGDKQQALEIAEYLRQAVEDSRTEHNFSSVSKVVTLSIGVSSIYPNSMQVLMRKVNGALSEAQSAGRNQVYADFANDIELPVEQFSQPVESEVVAQEIVVEEIEEVEESHLQQFLLDMGIADRQQFNQGSVNLWKECKTENELLSMLVCEIDYLQPYIEHCGKMASEDVLLITGCALQQTCEKFGGFVYYMGDDKYIVLLKGGNATNAFRVAEQLHTFVRESETEHGYSEVSDNVTISVGLSSLFPDESNSMQMLMTETNRALNVAIKTGRNQTSVR